MSGEERLPEERWRKVEMSGSLRGRKSEEMNQSNTSFPRGSEVLFKSGWQDAAVFDIAFCGPFLRRLGHLFST